MQVDSQAWPQILSLMIKSIEKQMHYVVYYKWMYRFYNFDEATPLPKRVPCRAASARY